MGPGPAVPGYVCSKSRPGKPTFQHCGYLGCSKQLIGYSIWPVLSRSTHKLRTRCFMLLLGKQKQLQHATGIVLPAYEVQSCLAKPCADLGPVPPLLDTDWTRREGWVGWIGPRWCVSLPAGSRACFAKLTSQYTKQRNSLVLAGPARACARKQLQHKSSPRHCPGCRLQTLNFA